MDDTRTMARKLGVDETALRLWLDQMVARIPEKLEAGMSFDDAAAEANEDYRKLLIEMVEGKTVRACVAREFIFWKTYLQGRGETEGLNLKALEKTIDSEKLADLDTLQIEKSAFSLF